MIMDTTSYWRRSSVLPRFKKINSDCTVEVVVIGAGITGTTAAYLLKKSGHTVALLERGRCGGFDTANTTAHVTCVTDIRLHELVRKFDKETAQAVWEGGRGAINLVFNNVRNENIHCDFAWVPGYLCSASEANPKKDRQSLEKDCDLAKELGFPAEFMHSVPLLHRCGVKFPHQAKFHPLKYLAALLRTIPGKGSYIFENTESTEIQAEPLEVKTGKNRIRCSYVVLATHNPLMGTTNLASATLFQTKLFLYTSYAVGAKIPANTAPEASFWDTGEPYNYLRVDRCRGFDYAILGGEDHKTGQIKKTVSVYAGLERKLKRLIPAAKIDARWSGQVIETVDGLPYIGESADRQFIATGFSGNGMTFGTLAAMMAVDAFLNRENPWQKLFDVHRKKVFGGAMNYLLENKDYPRYLLQNWFAHAEGKSLRSLRPNEGKILQLEGKKVAAYRDASGKISLCSPVCTHLKCIVGWNDAEKTWDCPCHGSRFAATGEVLTGPAEQPLKQIDLPNK
jgi:glycine/D-amino acid oxidase-like deaminating enzyme/nitrite reductase/ring-hydroxylating ferredoxin subunit